MLQCEKLEPSIEGVLTCDGDLSSAVWVEHSKIYVSINIVQLLLPLSLNAPPLLDLQGVSDGAAAVVIASEDALNEHKLTPLARIVAYHVSGCDPSIMGIGEWHHC